MELSCGDDSRIKPRVLNTDSKLLRVEISLDDGFVLMEVYRPDHICLPMIDMSFIQSNVKDLDLVNYWYRYEFESAQQMVDDLDGLLKADAGITEARRQAETIKQLDSTMRYLNKLNLELQVKINEGDEDRQALVRKIRRLENQLASQATVYKKKNATARDNLKREYIRELARVYKLFGAGYFEEGLLSPELSPELARDFKRFKEEGLSESLGYKMFKKEG